MRSLVHFRRRHYGAKLYHTSRHRRDQKVVRTMLQPDRARRGIRYPGSRDYSGRVGIRENHIRWYAEKVGEWGNEQREQSGAVYVAES